MRQEGHSGEHKGSTTREQEQVGQSAEKKQTIGGATSSRSGSFQSEPLLSEGGRSEPLRESIDKQRWEDEGGHIKGVEESRPHSMKEKAGDVCQKMMSQVSGYPVATVLTAVGLGIAGSMWYSSRQNRKLTRMQKMWRSFDGHYFKDAGRKAENLFHESGDYLERAARKVDRQREKAVDAISHNPLLGSGVGVLALGAVAYLLFGRSKRDSKSLNQCSRQELYDRAQDLDIPGRSSMSKRELIRAIESCQ